MSTIQKVMKLLPDDYTETVAKYYGNTREVYPEKEINTWTGLSRAERSILIGIRKHMQERTTVKKGPKGWTGARVVDVAQWSGLSEVHAGRLIRGLQQKHVLEVVGKKQTHPGSKKGYAIHKQSCCF